MHASSRIAVVLLLCGAAVCGCVGVLYSILGPKCNEWDAKFIRWFDPEKLSWAQTLGLLLIGIGFIGLLIWSSK